MTWEWVAFLAVVAVWTLGVLAVTSWKEVRMAQLMPDEVIAQAVEKAAADEQR